MMESARFGVRHELSHEHVDHLVALYQGSWWAAERERSEVDLMLASTDVVFALIEKSSDRLVGFARALTDDVYFAMVFDVMVASDYQGRGLGRLLLDAVVVHPRLAQVQSLELVCQPDLVPFYRQWGFDRAVGSSTLLRRVPPAP